MVKLFVSVNWSILMEGTLKKKKKGLLIYMDTYFIT